MYDSEEYQLAREKATRLYETFGKVSCPALKNESVYFSQKGLKHLFYKSEKRPRNKKDQIIRFNLLEKAKYVLEISTTFQEYEENFEYLTVIKKGKGFKENTLVCYWGFVAVITNQRIKVVVRQVGNGRKEFHSIIPAWLTKYYRGIKILYNSPNKGILADELGNTTE